MIASLPWYEVPNTELLYDELWNYLRVNLYQEGFKYETPLNLERNKSLDYILAEPSLLVSQTCGFDIAEQLPNPLRVIGTFSYNSKSGTYSSYIVVHENSRFYKLSDLVDKSFVANDPRSFSGYHAMAYILKKKPTEFFRHIFWSGSHLDSLRFIQSYTADVAAIDRNTFELLRKFSPQNLAHIRIIAESDRVPAPPLVTSVNWNEDEFLSICRAFKRLFTELESRALCRKLLIEELVLWGNDDYKTLGHYDNLQSLSSKFNLKSISY